MSVTKELLRAENLADLDGLSQMPLLPSQRYASAKISSYILDSELGGYSFYLTGPRGNGKTYAVLKTVMHAKKEKPDLSIAFLTSQPNGEFVYHPAFNKNIEDTNLIVLNDMHNALQAVCNESVNKEQTVDRLLKVFGPVRGKKAKSVVVTDAPLSLYANQIGDKRLSETLHDSYFLTPDELVTGKYDDLAQISENYGLNADKRLLWSIHHTRPNIRYLLSLGYLYGSAISDLHRLVEKAKEEKSYQSLVGGSKGSKNPLKLLFDRPVINNQEEALELVQQIEASGFHFPRTSDLLETIGKIDDRLLTRREKIPYVPTAEANFLHSFRHGVKKYWDLPSLWKTFPARDFDEQWSADRGIYDYGYIRRCLDSEGFFRELRVPLIFVLGEPLYDVIVPRIVQEGIQLR